MDTTYKYKAFISYSHQDQKFGKWLHKEIENYKIPKSLRQKYPNLPKDLKRSIFIDDEELPIASALPDNLSHALESSELLIVVCSPSATESYWVDKEIAYFKHYHGEGKVLAVLKEGEPNATYSTVYDNNLEAFPKSLRYKLDSGSELTKERTEPLAADARKRSNRKKALLKLIAGILKVNFADLWEREKRETRKRRVIAGTLISIFVSLAFYASSQFAGKHVNKELERVTKQIASIEYSIRHDELPMGKIIVLNEELKKLEELKKAKEDTQKTLGTLKTSLGKKAQEVYLKKGATAAIEILTSRDALSRKEQLKKELSHEEITLAKLYVETNEFDKAQESYENAIAIFFDYDNVMGYVELLYKNHSYHKAIRILKNLQTNHLDESEQAGVLNAFGNLYNVTNQFNKSETAYIDSIQIKRSLAKNSPDIYNPILASSLHNLSVLYQINRQLNNQEQALNEALMLYKISVKNNPERYTPELAKVYSGLGIVYKRLNKNEKAEEAYSEALILYKTLSQTYNINIAMTLIDLADIYTKNHKKEKSKEACVDALKLMKNIFTINASVNNSKMANLFMKLGDVFQKNNENKKAENSYIEALKVRRALAIKYPSSYLPEVASTLNIMGYFYYITNQVQKAENANSEALKLYQTLAKTKKSIYDPRIAITFQYLGNVYAKSNKLKQSENAYIKALTLYRILVIQSPTTYKDKMGHILSNLGSIYQRQNKPGEAEATFNEGLKIYRYLATLYPNVYSDDVVFLLNKLEGLYYDTNELKKAEKVNASTLKLYKSLSKYKSRIYDIGYSETLIRRVSLLNNPIEFLNEAESILQKYKGEGEADLLLKKIEILRKRGKT